MGQTIPLSPPRALDAWLAPIRDLRAPGRVQESAPAWSLRSGTESDFDAVLELWKVAGSTPMISDTREALAGLLAVDSQALIVAEADGAVVGSLIASWDGWRGSFHRLAVAPDQRRRGLARALVCEGEARLRGRGAVGLSAIVAADRDAATGFWESIGFHAQARRVRFVRSLGRPAA